MTPLAIFYADDDEDDMMFFNDAVEKISGNSAKKIRLHLHLNGSSLIENIKKNKDHNGVVFLDINMPMKNGMELLQEIRKESEIREFPVVMYSTSSNPANIEQCRQLGADFYAVKPSNFNDLVTLVSEFVAINWKNGHTRPAGFLYNGKFLS